MMYALLRSSRDWWTGDAYKIRNAGWFPIKGNSFDICDTFGKYVTSKRARVQSVTRSWSGRCARTVVRPVLFGEWTVGLAVLHCVAIVRLLFTTERSVQAYTDRCACVRYIVKDDLSVPKCDCVAEVCRAGIRFCLILIIVKVQRADEFDKHTRCIQLVAF